MTGRRINKKQMLPGETRAAAFARLHPRTSVPTPNFRKKVQAVLAKSGETKYVAEGVAVTGVVDTIGVPTDLTPILPKLAQGVGSNQRIGQSVSNAHGRVDFQFFLIPAGSNYPTQDVWVKIFKLTSKQAKSYGQVALLPGNTLLDQGNQTTTDWTTAASAPSYNQMPLSKEDFAGSSKLIRLTKNQGGPNGDLSPGQAPNTFGHPAALYSMTWKHKGKLMYDDQASNQPTNFAPIYAIVAFNTDNTPFNGLIQYVARKHYWYKDI